MSLEIIVFLMIWSRKHFKFWDTIPLTRFITVRLILTDLSKVWIGHCSEKRRS